MAPGFESVDSIDCTSSLVALTEQGEKGLLSLPACSIWDIGLPSLDWISRYQLPCFSGLWIQTRIAPVTFLDLIASESLWDFITSVITQVNLHHTNRNVTEGLGFSQSNFFLKKVISCVIIEKWCVCVYTYIIYTCISF